MMGTLAVAAGGAAGSLLRYWGTLAAARLGWVEFPWNTIPINILGSLVLGWFSAVGLGGVPLFAQITDYLKGLDWRQYVLSYSDKQNLLVLAIPGVLGLLVIILRFMTTGPVGHK